mmetsp:Transcript_29110/g.73170  ORF Transcript_29110/g.73170 Transcript_29110/m.73170 type:complete len:214 (+) Transcript_29110:104-745(+)|eukprot:CAMPEP_0177641152 /NCGR_PEP_ID=MMETSP0447-20121125/6918_1 /TAXON_ID=0 /ORGANISM="Stygamoeba regulata, Strain BSH-02190019" /LENGTH=213 /DNA_ID=CAMNT_0019143259 /DNA_START=99 /DNA_END=740 /DNA_ORIENTATION=+
MKLRQTFSKGAWLPTSLSKKGMPSLEDLGSLFPAQDGQLTASVAVLGLDGSGKSSLVNRFASGSWEEDLDPTIEAKYDRQVSFEEGIEIHFRVLDTVESIERLGAVDEFPESRTCNVIVVNVTKRDSLEWAKKKLAIYAEATCILVGSQADVSPREVSFEECVALAEEADVPYIETSAKDNIRVNDAFVLALQHHIAKKAPECGAGAGKCTIA